MTANLSRSPLRQHQLGLGVPSALAVTTTTTGRQSTADLTLSPSPQLGGGVTVERDRCHDGSQQLLERELCNGCDRKTPRQHGWNPPTTKRWHNTVLATLQVVLLLGVIHGAAGQNVYGGALGEGFTCVVMQVSKGLRCCGRSDYGEIPGLVGSTYTTMPTADILTDVAEIAMGSGFSCARMNSTSAVRCWGVSTVGQCGYGGSADVTAITGPFLINLPSARRVFAGFMHACALVGNSGGLRCWGSNGSGQLGQGVTGASVYVPPPTDAITGVSHVALGLMSTCIVMTANGGVRCWGDNTCKFRVGRHL